METTHAASSPSFSNHVNATLKLGVPLVVMQVTFMLINVTDTVMLGWLGVDELAAGTLAFQLIFIVFIFGLGISAALMPLIASALAQDDEQMVRRATRMGLWALFMTVMIFMVPLLFSEQILLLLGQEAHLAALAAQYMVIAQWSLVPAFLHVGLRNFLLSIEHTKAVLVITFAAALLNAALNYALIFGYWGAPRLEMFGAGLATVLTNLAILLAVAVYVKWSIVGRPFGIFDRLWRPDWPAFKTVLRLGIPISISIFAEAGLFSAASLMIGWIGTVPLAAHGIALQLASLAFMVPLGFSQAASIRVGRASGRNDKMAITQAAKAVVALTLAFACISALVFWIMPEPLIRLFLDHTNPDASAVLVYAVPLLYVAAAFQIADTLQAVAGGNLRGLQDTRVPMLIATFAYWPIGMGAAYVLAFPLGFGGIGVWCGLVIGLTVAAIGLSHRFARREALGLI